MASHKYVSPGICSEQLLSPVAALCPSLLEEHEENNLPLGYLSSKVRKSDYFATYIFPVWRQPPSYTVAYAPQLE